MNPTLEFKSFGGGGTEEMFFFGGSLFLLTGVLFSRYCLLTINKDNGLQKVMTADHLDF